jgi:hypothetical protein
VGLFEYVLAARTGLRPQNTLVFFVLLLGDSFMKKFALLFAVLFGLCLTGCGDEANKKTNPAGQGTSKTP